MGREEAGLALKAEDGAVHVGLAEQDAGIVGEVTGGEIVSAVHDDVVRAEDLEGVLAGKARVVQDDLDAGVKAVKRIRG